MAMCVGCSCVSLILFIGMGKKQSKEKKEEEEETKINDKRMIYIDEFGNFVVGKWSGGRTESNDID
jgi:putative Ca2+/H+ antiporter (TMEM165/GDT1 family)